MSRLGSTEYMDKPNREKKKLSKKAKIIISIIVVLLILIAIPSIYVWSKINKMNIVGLDEKDLGINEDLYNELSGELSASEFKDVKTIVFFGSDSRDTSDASAGRADSIMIASLNPKTKSLKLISIPRDTYVSVEGYGKTKINHAYAYGGEQLMIKTINSNFGLNISEYATIDFSGLINIINEVGGVQLEINKAEMDVLNDYLKDSYKLTGKAYVPMTKYGKVTLNGEQALAHSRNRYVGSDFTRANRQRDVLTALFTKISTMEKTKILSLVDSFLSEVKTNINVTSYMGVLTSVIANKDSYVSNIVSTQIPSTDYGKGQTIGGVYYFVGDLAKSKSDFIEYIYKK
jgi:LCP family protein required for cell wall assembly